MKIPAELFAREQFYQDVREACMKSMENRIKNYSMLMHFYTYGAGHGEPEAPYNKIEPIVDTLSAFLYAADSTRFSVHLGPEVHEIEWTKAPAITERMNSEWLNNGADQMFSEALKLSMVYGSTIMKWLARGDCLQPHIIEPHCFGVYREDINSLDRQEAMCQVYYITRTQLEEELESHPQKGKILSQITAKPVADGEKRQDMLTTIVLNNAFGSGPLTPGNTATGSGAAPWGATQIGYDPEIGTDLVEMSELWIRDDDLKDYRTVTMADGRITIYDRANIWVDKAHPFTQVCPRPRHGYFWGEITIAGMIELQRKRNIAMRRIDNFRDKQADPPSDVQGFTGAVEEINLALNTAGGLAQLGDSPMAKITQHKRDVPSDLYQDIREIDEMFHEKAALPPILMGRGESGVRSGRQTSELGRFASARIKKSALAIEDCLDTFITAGYKGMRKYNADELMTQPTKPGEKPMKFIMAQADSSMLIKVDAHSNSPLFVEDQRSLATDLLESRSIDRSRFIRMLNPPSKDILLRELKAIEQHEAEAAKAKAQQEQAMVAAKHAPKPPGAG